MLRHFPVLKEDCLEGILGFEVVAHHEFVLYFFVLSKGKQYVDDIATEMTARVDEAIGVPVGSV